MTSKGQNYAFITHDESEDDNENLSEENKLNENSEEDEWLTIKNFIQSLMQGKIMQNQQYFNFNWLCFTIIYPVSVFLVIFIKALHEPPC